MFDRFGDRFAISRQGDQHRRTGFLARPFADDAVPTGWQQQNCRMPGGDDNTWISKPDFQGLFIALDGPSNGAIAQSHIGPNDPAQKTGHNRATQDGFHPAVCSDDWRMRKECRYRNAQLEPTNWAHLHDF